MNKLFIGIMAMIMVSCTSQLMDIDAAEAPRSGRWINKQTYLDTDGDTIQASPENYNLGKNCLYYYSPFDDKHYMVVKGEIDESHFETAVEAISTGWVDELNIDPDSVPMKQRTELIKAWNEFLEYDGFDPEELN